MNNNNFVPLSKTKQAFLFSNIIKFYTLEISVWIVL